MLPYQPQQNDAGRIYADLAMMGSRGLAGGIQQAGQSISQDINTMNDLWRRQQMAQGSGQVARSAMATDANGNSQPISQGDLDAMNPFQRMGAAQAMTEMYPAMVKNNYYNQMMGYRYDKMGQGGANGGSDPLVPVQ